MTSDTSTDRAQIAQWRADGMTQVKSRCSYCSGRGRIAIGIETREGMASTYDVPVYKTCSDCPDQRQAGEVERMREERDKSLARVAEMEDALRLQRELSHAFAELSVQVAGKKGEK